MKLFNPALAGQKLGLKGGVIVEVGADGSVEVSDEETIAALKASKFQSADEYVAPKAVSKQRPAQPVAQTQPPKVEEVSQPEPEPEEDEEEEDEEEDEEEIEVDDLGELNAKDAVEKVKSEDRIEVLEAWQESEGEGKQRKTVLRTIEERIAEVQDA